MAFRSSFRAAAAALALALLALVGGPAPAAAQGAPRETVEIVSETSNGYGRLVFVWPRAVRAQASIADGVLVVRFARPFRFAESTQLGPIASYVSLIRQDDDLRTVRMPLQKPSRLHTSAAGRRFAVDILPEGFAGEPPDIADPDAPKAAEAEPEIMKVRLRIGVHTDHTRLVFDWPKRVEYEAGVAEGTATLRFAAPAEIDVRRLNENPPAWVRAGRASAGDDATIVEIDVDPGSAVETSRSGNRIVVDVKRPANEDAADPVAILPDELKPAADPAAEPKPEGEAHADAKPGEPDAPDAPDHPKPHGESEHAPEPAPTPEAAPPAAPAESHAAAEPEDHAEKPEEAAHEPEAAPTKPAAVPAFEVRRERGRLTLVLPAATSSGAAMFVRGSQATIALAESGPIDAAKALTGNSDMLAGADVRSEGGATVLTLSLKRPMALTAGASGGAWTATLTADPLAPPAPIVLLRDARAAGPGRVRAIAARVAEIAELTDPLTGERLLAGLASGAPQGLIAARAYVDFAAEPTAQGLLIRPFDDGLTLTPRPDDVLIEAPGGLTLSAGTVAQYAPDREALGDPVSPAAMDFVSWEGEGGFRDAKAARLAAFGAEGEPTAARFDLARFYLARGLAAEALGALAVMESDDEGVLNDPAFRALRGATRLLMGRPAEALEDLNARGLADDPNAALFLGLALRDLGRFSEARDAFAKGEAMIARFRPDWQARFLTAGAEAALETNAVDMTDRFLGAMPKAGAGRREAVMADLVRARLADRLAQDEKALRLYEAVAESGYRPLAVRGELGRIVVQERTKAITSAQAIEALDRLRWRWRGDETELSVLERLGKLQVAGGDYRGGLQTLRMAALGFPGTEAARRVQDAMAAVFEELFLKGGADALPPVQALGLYYDFKELTPIGAMGDEMVRRLADRLIAVDLLEQAAELLEHQVEKRLDGIARAQVAARLAAVRLMNREPQKALAALRASSVTRLPEDLALQRRLLTARAYSDLKQPDAALEAIELDETPPARALRADVLWAASNWPEAAKAIEVLLEGKDAPGAGLADGERRDVLRAAIAYTMADDAAGLAGLRRRFVEKMASAPEAAAFEAVTREIDPSGVEFRDLAKSVAAVDTLDAFLKSLGLGKPDAPPAGAQQAAAN